MSELNIQTVAPAPDCLSTTGIAIASGKGGVGKTNVVANLAAALATRGRRVLLVDADFGLGNLDVLLGLSPRYHVGHLLTGERALEEVLVEGPADMRILPAASGLPSLTTMTERDRRTLSEAIQRAAEGVDYVLLDTSAGISDNVTGVLAASLRTLVVTDPEPTSLVDAYALIKVMRRMHPSQPMEVVVNSACGESEALDVHHQIEKATTRFLSHSVKLFGWVANDPCVQRAVREQKLVVLEHPESKAAESFARLAGKLDREMRPGTPRAAEVVPFRAREELR